MHDASHILYGNGHDIIYIYYLPSQKKQNAITKYARKSKASQTIEKRVLRRRFMPMTLPKVR